MSGHSKWSTIKRQKGAQDQKRGALFSKLTHAITIAAKTGGADPSSNFKLRLAMSQAKQANMPKQNIERAIERGASKEGGQELTETVYEAFGPGGSAVIIETMTDNRNRLVSELKYTLTKNEGKLAENGTALRLFKRCGRVEIPTDSPAKTEATTLMLIDAAADDVAEDTENNVVVGLFPLEIFNSAVKQLEAKRINHTADVIFEPIQTASLGDRDKKRLANLVHGLLELDGVQTVHSNAS